MYPDSAMKKNLFYFVFFVAFASLFFVACGNTDQGAVSGVQGAGAISEDHGGNFASDDSANETKVPLTSYSVPILMYHYIRDYTDPNDQIGIGLSVSPKTFEDQLRWLKENYYQSVSMDYLLGAYKLKGTKPIILTFDDGYQDAYDQAFPLLVKYGFQATFYVIVDKVGTGGYLTWNEILKMSEAGMNFGSHTLSHPDLRNLSEDLLMKELRESKGILEEKLSGGGGGGDGASAGGVLYGGSDGASAWSLHVTNFCYPSGKYNSKAIEVLKKLGYKTAVTTHSGIANEKTDIFELPRIRVTNGTKLESFLR